FDEAQFDAVVCCVSVDYLVEPVAVFSDVARVLRPGGVFVNTFSNRCFPTKAILGWLQISEHERVHLVETYYRTARTATGEPCFTHIQSQLRNPGASGDPLWAVWGRRP
ncbi:MAG: methyltransferase domain-containing protein, partial [Myxococcota bacterium]